MSEDSLPKTDKSEWSLFAEPPTLERQYAVRQDEENNTYVLRLGHDPFSKKPRMIKGGNLVTVASDGTTSVGRKAGKHYGYVIGTIINEYFENNKELEHFDPKRHTIENLLKGHRIQLPYRPLRIIEDDLDTAQSQALRSRHSLHLPGPYSFIQAFRKKHKHSWIIEADDFLDDTVPLAGQRNKKARKTKREQSSESEPPTEESFSSNSSIPQPPRRSASSSPDIRSRLRTRKSKAPSRSNSKSSTESSDTSSQSSTSSSYSPSSSSSDSVKQQLKLDLNGSLLDEKYTFGSE